MSRITIKDIAKALNMHHSTVSRALRNDFRVKENTRKLVTEYAEKNGYQVNMSALQLRGSVKNVIAVVVPNVNHNFFSNIVSLITNRAVQHGYIVSVFQSNESYEQEQEIIKTVIQHNVAGVIASVTMETVHSDHFKKLKQFKIPLIFFDRICPDLDVPKVLVNNAEVVAKAVEIMLDRKCERIAHICGPQRVNVFRERHEGYLRTLIKHGKAYKETVYINSAFTIDDGRNAIQTLFAGPLVPDGLICDSNMLLIGVLLELKKRNLQIPDDISVIGFTDNPYVEAFSPGVISIVQPDEDIANNAFDLLLKHMNEETVEEPENIRVSAKIIYDYTY